MQPPPPLPTDALTPRHPKHTKTVAEQQLILSSAPNGGQEEPSSHTAGQPLSVLCSAGGGVEVSTNGVGGPYLSGGVGVEPRQAGHCRANLTHSVEATDRLEPALGLEREETVLSRTHEGLAGKERPGQRSKPAPATVSFKEKTKSRKPSQKVRPPQGHPGARRSRAKLRLVFRSADRIHKARIKFDWPRRCLLVWRAAIFVYIPRDKCPVGLLASFLSFSSTTPLWTALNIPIVSRGCLWGPLELRLLYHVALRILQTVCFSGLPCCAVPRDSCVVFLGHKFESYS